MSFELNFDFEKFAVQVIKTVDEIRSFGMEKDSPKSPIEPRINALYRAIGLPAVIDFTTGGKKFKEEKAIFNNGNTFANSNETDASKETLSYNTYKDPLNTRRASLNIKVESKEIKEVLHASKFMPSDSLYPKKRKRGAILPLVVDGHIEIGPNEKRISTAFLEKEENTGDGKTKLRKPLIEAIIYTRFKGVGIDNSNDSKRIKDSFIKSLDPKGTIGISEDLISADNALGINLEIAFSFRNALVTTTKSAIEAMKDISDVVKDVGENYVYENDNIAEQNPEKSTEDLVSKGALNVQEDEAKKKQAKNQSMLTLLEYSTEGGEIKNATDNILFSSVLSALAPSSKKAEIDEQELKNKKEKALEKVKVSVKRVDLFSGQFSGLSAVDVLVIMSALYEIPLEALIGLLNKQSKEGLSKQGDAYKKAVDSALSVGASIEILQKSVVSIYTWLDTVMRYTQKKANNSNKK